MASKNFGWADAQHQFTVTIDPWKECYVTGEQVTATVSGGIIGYSTTVDCWLIGSNSSTAARVGPTITLKSGNTPLYVQFVDIYNSGAKAVADPAIVTLFAANAPGATTISMPSSVWSGKTFTVSWKTVSGVTGYILERKENSGEWEEIYRGTAIKKTDSVGANVNTVQYRVKTYNQYHESDYSTSSAITVTHNTAPGVPASISVPGSIQGGSTITVSWGASTDAEGNLAGYIAERSTNGGSSWSQIYKGSARSTTNTVEFGTSSVVYRVKAYDSDGLESTYKTSSKITVINNTAPGVPASISVPSSIQGGTTVTISWGASTDAENNLEGYIMERSTDGGSTWAQIYQGSGRSTTNSVAFGTVSVMYRVKAYDNGGLQSAYRTSQQVMVINNNAPSAPSSLVVPSMVSGGEQLTVSWGAASDSDGNLAGYVLERQKNGGAWETLYDGTARTYTDTIIKGWLTVAYRVRAYDTYSLFSDYVISATRTVNNNTAPVISGQDSDLGLKKGGFLQAYTVSDAENDVVTVTEYVDAQELRSYQATLGQQAGITLSQETWLTLANGSHQLTVRASDGLAVSTRVWTFSKKETVICFRLAAPEETDTAATKVLVSPTWKIEGATAKVEACNNAFDTNPTWEDITAMILLNRVYNFTNKAKTASKWGVDFRFTIEKDKDYDGEVSITGFGGAYE